MSIIDVLIVLLIAAAVRRGMRVGLIRLVLSAIGLLIGLYVGSMVAGYLVGYIDSALARFITAIGLTFMIAATISSLGDMLGLLIDERTYRFKMAKLDTILGSLFEVTFTLLSVWLLASVLASSGVANIGQQIKRSFFVSQLNNVLPAPPDILAGLERVLSNNGFPTVFVGNEPEQPTVSSNVQLDPQVVEAAERSVVKVEGRGCGGKVDGTGFVVKPDIVLTNAHVVAGIESPYVYVGTKGYAAKTIYFDGQMDVAVLAVESLSLAPLPLSDAVGQNGDNVAAIGFPGGGTMTASGGAIIDQMSALGRDIYGRGLVTREIYRVAASIHQGNSGSPLINAEGKAIAMIFAKAVASDGVGYALLPEQYMEAVSAATLDAPALDTGVCTE
ncbi:hypothetical protein CR970_02875 [Candidatus Saccharibacteria bacterium]|nr:MAG: hypothetical protein CR970_02875 [Candidatus Saccharibacteria bacterium]